MVGLMGLADDARAFNPGNVGEEQQPSENRFAAYARQRSELAIALIPRRSVVFRKRYATDARHRDEPVVALR